MPISIINQGTLKSNRLSWKTNAKPPFRESCLKLYFNFMYYLLLVPFKIQINTGNQNNYVLKSNTIQKGACAVSHLCAFFSTIAYYKGNYSKHFAISSDISKLFGTVGNAACVLKMLSALNIVWFRQDVILEFLNMSKTLSFNVNNNIVLRNIKILTFVVTMIMYIAQILAPLFLDPNMYHGIQNVSEWLEVVFTRTTYTQRLLCKLLQILWMIVFCQGCSVYTMARLLIMFTSLQIKELGIQFENFVSEQSNGKVEQIVNEYDNIRARVESANSCSEGLLLATVISVIIRIANFPGVLRDETLAQLGIWYAGLIVSFLSGFLLTACDMPKRVCKVYKYIWKANNYILDNLISW